VLREDGGVAREEDVDADSDALTLLSMTIPLVYRCGDDFCVVSLRIVVKPYFTLFAMFILLCTIVATAFFP